jgi:hypothetical protein
MQLSALITFLLLIFLLYFGPYHDLIKNSIPHPVVDSYTIVVPFALLILGLIAYYFIKHPASIKKFTQYLTVLLMVLCIVEGVVFLIKWPRAVKDQHLLYHEKPICDSYTSCHPSDTSKADIYYLVFDEYASNSALQSLWQFDNRPITNWLTQQGFYIADKAISNYDFTIYSISSTFNMNYLAEDKGARAMNFAYILQGKRSMSNNETFCILQKEHYQIRFIAPFENSFENHGLTQSFPFRPWEGLYAGSFPERFIKDIAWNFIPALRKGAQTKANKNLPGKVFKQLAGETDLIINEIKSTVNPSSNRRPQFVYGHLSITHTPHLFDSLGHIRSLRDERSNQRYFDTYINQLRYANKVIKDLVEHIMQKNKKNTIIIIQGDHGFRQLPKHQKAWFHPTLSAFYFPDKNYASLRPGLSTVNTFRVVFNQYFCQRLPLLKDSTIFVEH